MIALGLTNICSALVTMERILRLHWHGSVTTHGAHGAHDSIWAVLKRSGSLRKYTMKAALVAVRLVEECLKKHTVY